MLNLALAARMMLGWPDWLAAWQPVDIHFLGVGFWILPRLRDPPKHGNTRLAWLVYALLNGGVLLVAAGSVVAAPAPVILLGRLAELMAAAAFAGHAWPRVRSAGSRGY
jgi:hypothetical protein